MSSINNFNPISILLYIFLRFSITKAGRKCCWRNGTQFRKFRRKLFHCETFGKSLQRVIVKTRSFSISATWVMKELLRSNSSHPWELTEEVTSSLRKLKNALVQCLSTFVWFVRFNTKNVIIFWNCTCFELLIWKI